MAPFSLKSIISTHRIVCIRSIKFQNISMILTYTQREIILHKVNIVSCGEVLEIFCGMGGKLWRNLFLSGSEWLAAEKYEIDWNVKIIGLNYIVGFK